jgi:hypothetical protein
LSERHLDDIADATIPMVDRPRFDDAYTTVGLDWGGGGDDNAATTVITVMEHIQHDGDDVEHVISTIDVLDKGLSKRDEFESLEEYIQAFDADRVLVDEGYGSSRREDLQNGNGTKYESDGYDNLYGVRFGNISDNFKWVDSSERNLFTVKRSHYARRFVDAIRSRRVRLPAGNISTGAYGSDDELGTKIYRQMTSPYEERKSTSSSRKTVIKTEGGSRDDVFFASMYSWLGYSLDAFGPTNSVVEFRTQSAPGL